MITAKEATQAAIKYFQEVFNGRYDNLAVEEIELSSDEKFWSITLGYNMMSTMTMLVPTSQRTYKEFKVSAESGKVTAMKIHNV